VRTSSLVLALATLAACSGGLGDAPGAPPAGEGGYGSTTSGAGGHGGAATTGTPAGGSSSTSGTTTGGAGGSPGAGGGGGAGLAPRSVIAPGFTFELQDLGIGAHTGAALDAAILALGLGDPVARAPFTDAITGTPSVQRVDTEGLPLPFVAEWDYSCIHIPSGAVDGSGLPRDGFPCFDGSQGCAAPAHAGEAYDRAMAYLFARRDRELASFPTTKRWIAHTGHYLFPHLSAAAGAALIATEVGETIVSTQAHVAFTRGAAAQRAIPWGVDMSPWFGPGVTDYWQGDDRVWCERDGNGVCVTYYSGPDHGHSTSLTLRTWMLAYLGGATWVEQEGASVNFFMSPAADAALSPLGELARDFHAFVVANPDRGTPYVPFGVVMDYYHGLGVGTWAAPPGAEVAWNHFPLDAEQRAGLAALDGLFPGSFRFGPQTELGFLVDGPVGDTVDLLSDVSDPAYVQAAVAHPVLAMVGRVSWTQAWKDAVWNQLLAQGGTLVLGAGPTEDVAWADLGAPALGPLLPGVPADQVGVASVLAGRVVRVAAPALFGATFASLAEGVVPFAIGGTGYSLSRLDATTWIVALYDHRGVDKAPLAAATVVGAPIGASVAPRGGRVVTGVTPLRAAHPPTWTPGAVAVTVDPGDVVVLRVTTD
jgi:hypothetical protein